MAEMEGKSQVFVMMNDDTHAKIIQSLYDGYTYKYLSKTFNK
jgi:hypothetical protein